MTTEERELRDKLYTQRLEEYAKTGDIYHTLTLGEAQDIWREYQAGNIKLKEDRVVSPFIPIQKT